MDDIKGMRKVSNLIAAFDVPDNYKELMDKMIDEIKEQKGKAKGYTLDVAKSLEDLEDPVEAEREKEREREVSPEVDERAKRDAFKRKRELEVFVGGLPYNADENEIGSFFKEKGIQTAACRLLRSNFLLI